MPIPAVPACAAQVECAPAMPEGMTTEVERKTRFMPNGTPVVASPVFDMLPRQSTRVLMLLQVCEPPMSLQ